MLFAPDITLLNPISEELSVAAFKASTCSQSSAVSHKQSLDRDELHCNELSSDMLSSCRKREVQQMFCH